MENFNFSFPNINTEFEFSSVIEPTNSPKSPADHLFSNGRLLPHFFPSQTANVITRSTSRASSVSSKDSLLSSRSSSTISRTSSSSSSARTSTSTESSEQKKLFLKRVKSKHKTALVHQYEGLSRQWQFITPAPVTKQRSRKKKSGIVVKKENNGIKEVCFCWRVLRWFVWVCQKCHSMESAVIEDGFPRNMKV